ncbi:winged helix-turn-helix domain-containing protein [Desulforamulus hydrothermalis]|uniref:Regulatory protein LysR n=1 Tax=Desulforamulus hydrothermalis Lam5 = DSM 18033 TaxID=1121428 RepID=K8DYY9_9FIRM|nr:LysR family transcriptional regulator [Desulforamulus hydrothermalis]CCO08070.1 Regulatory protein LysR [Desulforamulus hydrothermalis Lam5 = DSM 18033]SHG82731.1 molybdate transport system regulatory protein [Desulforamulus hydrothermalis Lam5 = DSM 18033]
MSKRTDGEKKSRPLAELFQPGCKVWLESGGTNFGDGLYYLLMNVKEYGSISQAARSMGMSYRAAWGKIKTAEKNWGIKLVETQVGGDAGGGATLTTDGNRLLACYGVFRSRLEQALAEIFQDSFRAT